MKVDRVLPRLRTALSDLPEATVRRGVVTSAGWRVTTLLSPTGDSVAVSYRNPTGGGEGAERSLIAGCLTRLTDMLGEEFKVEQHAGTHGADCPTGLLGPHVHIMDK